MCKKKGMLKEKIRRKPPSGNTEGNFEKEVNIVCQKKEHQMLTNLLSQTDLQIKWQFWFYECSQPRNQTVDLISNLQKRMLQIPLQKTTALHQNCAPNIATALEG